MQYVLLTTYFNNLYRAAQLWLAYRNLLYLKQLLDCEVLLKLAECDRIKVTVGELLYIHPVHNGVGVPAKYTLESDSGYNSFMLFSLCFKISVIC